MAAGIGRLLLAALTVLVLGQWAEAVAALPNELNEEDHQQHGGGLSFLPHRAEPESDTMDLVLGGLQTHHGREHLEPRTP